MKSRLAALALTMLALTLIAFRSKGTEQLAWLAGSWSGTQAGVQVEEVWIVPKAGVMLGMHRDVFASGKSFFEFLRIAETDDGVALFASPEGQPPTRFDMVFSSERRVEFENPTHDFPQRILYWLDEDGSLHARIEGSDQGREKHFEWVWSRDRNAFGQGRSGSGAE
jgi:hypothetical protein